MSSVFIWKALRAEGGIARRIGAGGQAMIITTMMDCCLPSISRIRRRSNSTLPSSHIHHHDPISRSQGEGGGLPLCHLYHQQSYAPPSSMSLIQQRRHFSSHKNKPDNEDDAKEGGGEGLKQNATAVVVAKPITTDQLGEEEHQKASIHGREGGIPGVHYPTEGRLAMLYTCKVCETRSVKAFSRKAYNEGVVIVRCPVCENLHLVADRLGWFSDESWDVKKVLDEQAERVLSVTDENVMELTAKDMLGSDPVLTDAAVAEIEGEGKEKK